MLWVVAEAEALGKRRQALRTISSEATLLFVPLVASWRAARSRSAQLEVRNRRDSLAWLTLGQGGVGFG